LCKRLCRKIRTWYNELVLYLTENTYVSEATKEYKRRIREKAQLFFLNENVLMHKGGKGRQQRVVRRAEVQELVQQMHASVVGDCHFGINATHRQHQGRASQSTVLSHAVRVWVCCCAAQRGHDHPRT